MKITRIFITSRNEKGFGNINEVKKEIYGYGER
jgi:hypothetical protein